MSSYGDVMGNSVKVWKYVYWSSVVSHVCWSITEAETHDR